MPDSEMDAIGACFIGGVSAYDGSAVIGAILLDVINQGMSIIGLE